MARKNLLDGLTGKKLTADNSEPSALPTGGRRHQPLSLTGKGAFGAVTRGIEELSARANAAKDIEEKLLSGQVIVELDPALITDSFVLDRFSNDDGEYQALKDSIASKGQDTPILVRPHPTEVGRYQVAFGHRRLRVAKDLGHQVRAVVKQLSDQDLVIAQGQENSARANLSFVERARFAAALEARGYARDIIMAALCVDKTVVSRMISVMAGIPQELINTIGSAPSVGRSRWLELLNLVERYGAECDIDYVFAGRALREVPSDERFELIFRDFARRERASVVSDGRKREKRLAYGNWSAANGTAIVKASTKGAEFSLSFDERIAPGFGRFLFDQMERLFQAYAASNEPKKQ